jgi:hypothetical protein
MNFEEVKSEIKKVSTIINEIDEKDFDDIKDVEIQESFIRELLFDYCVNQKYEIDGFPFVHLKRIEDQEPGYDEDYLTGERMDYYIHRLALEKEDVFELCMENNLRYFPDFNPKQIKGLIEDFVAMDKQENLSFDLTPEEIEEATREINQDRPKWP